MARMSAFSAAQEKIRPWWQEKDFGNQALNALKIGFAAVLCLWLGDLLGLVHSYWAAVTAIVVMGTDNTVTFSSCRDRILGTAIGAFLGWLTCYVWHGHYLLYGLAIAVCLLACGVLKFDKAGRLAGVALSIIVLVKIDGGPGRAAIDRFLEVGLGIVIALVVTLFIFPAKTEKMEVRATS
jgi:uncharacterized membrane protein YccC